MFTKSSIISAVAIALAASAQAQTQRQTPADAVNPTATYRMNVVSRTTRAVSYRHRSGATKINFEGTNLMPSASGEARVDSKRGAMKIEVELSGLDKPTSFGNEYLTYVLWAISPEGRPVNIGEVLVGSNHRSELDVTTDLQAFALIVTAEPYYAVRRPSNVVILENSIRSDTVGATEVVDAKYELIDRGGYIPTGYNFDPVVLNAKLPLEFFEARNAVRIAQSAGAERYAAPSYETAVNEMSQADALATSRHENKKSLISLSREVVQTAEDAREISVKQIDEERAAAERTAGANREAEDKARANDEYSVASSPKAKPLMPFVSARKPTATISRPRPQHNKPLMLRSTRSNPAIPPSNNNKLRKRFPTAVVPPPPHPMPSFNKPCAIAKSFVLVSCNSSI